MSKFKNGAIDILVSTSVVDVGVDISNASVMMIEGADRFGLAALHQFRGRVGRSQHQSYCFVFSDLNTQPIVERLKFFETHHNGFELAEKDLEIRGPGEVYGRQQSGMMQLQLAKLTDTELIRQARAAAEDIAPRLKEFPELNKKIRASGQIVHLE